MEGIGAAVSAALSVVLKTLDLLNPGRAERIRRLKEEILTEENRGYEADDAKIETLWKKVGLEIEACESEIISRLTSK